jgi:hypothetical protein
MTREISSDTQCTFIKANGERCQAQKLRGSPFCYFHSPQVIVERAEARRRGGLNRHGPKGETGSYIIKSPEDVLIILEDAINDACGLDNTAGRAKAIGYLVQIILKGFEVVELESRLKALEDKVFERK